MSSYSEGQTHQLMDRFEAEGFTSADLTNLGQFANLGGIRAVINGRAKIVPIKPRLLELVATVKIGGAEQFAAADHFMVGQAGIAWLGDNFRNNFLSKVEEDVQTATLNVWKLRKNALDELIRAKLGADREETALAYLFGLLAQQADGKTGPLLTDGRANIFYIRDAKGVIWAVGADRHSVGWSVDALSVTSPRRWLAGCQVFSRDS